MKNIFIQKIIPNKEIGNKPSQYLVTITKKASLQECHILWKDELLYYLEEKLT